MFRGFVTFRGLHLIHAAHAVGFHRGDGLAKQDKIEAGKGLDWRMVGNVAVYLLSGLGAEYIILTWHDDVMLYGCGLILLDAGDAGRKGLVGILTNAHHSPREISVEFCYAMSLIIPVCKN